MRIWVKPDLLSKLGITVPEILNAINEQNVIVPGGKFGAEPSPPGTEFTYTVRLPERFNSPEAFEEIVVRTNSDGSQVKISDVASVELGVESYNVMARFPKRSAPSLPSIRRRGPMQWIWPARLLRLWMI